ncbi:MAG: hypothetical protein ACJ714_16240 [Ornithinibacter sp.]
MSDQSTPGPSPSQPEQPAADTAALPPQPVPQSPQPAQPAGHGWSAAPTAAAPAPPGWVPPGGPAGPPSGPRRWWSEATSTGGGRAALGLAAALAALVVVVGLGLTAALVVSHHGDGGRGFMTSGRDDRGPFDEQGPRMGRGNGQGNRNAVPQLPGQGAPVAPRGPRQGLGMGAGAALGAVLHGEFTTSVTGTPTVMVVQTGQVTAYTAGKSLAVKSTDGFTATYTLDGTAPVIGNAATPVAVGATVRVVAAKEGMKVTAIMVG